MLTPGRYMGARVQEDDGEPFEEMMQRLARQILKDPYNFKRETRIKSTPSPLKTP
jgi:hypothetical protein